MRVVAQMLVFVVAVPFLPLLISWHWDWWEAWVYALICILGFVISRVLAARRHRFASFCGTLAHRGYDLRF